MSQRRFESFSQNGEDVVLWRALHDVGRGRYVEVGANHPVNDSMSMAFYAQGWSGITVEPDPEFAGLHREQRPRDILVEAAITTEEGGACRFHVVDGTGLSTLDDELAERHAGAGYETHEIEVATRRLDRILEEAGWAGQDIHFMSVDTEGSERVVLESVDLSTWRPWVLVVEAVEPNSTVPTRDAWEDIVLKADYHFCLFDGVSCFYVASEHQADLEAALSYPACILDDYSTLALREAERTAGMVPALVEDAARWRTEAMSRWADVMASRDELDSLRSELDELQERHRKLSTAHHELAQQAHGLHLQIIEIHHSTSWRVTAPLRSASRFLPRRRTAP